MIDYTLMGNNIRELRENTGINQVDFAESVGISTRRLSAIENGHVENLSLNTVSRIAETLNCQISDLILDIVPEDKIINTYHNLQHIIDCSNYIYRNPYRKISTLSQLILILPLINLNDLFDISNRVGGHLFGNEDYVSQEIGYAFRNIPECKAKSYVKRLLAIIESAPWKENPGIPVALALEEEVSTLLQSDHEFEEEYNAYIKAIEEKANIAKTLHQFIDSYISSENKLM